MIKKNLFKQIKIYQIDAAGKSMGRLATEVAIIIRGKKQPNFSANTIPPVEVVISNIDKTKISEQKLKDKIFYHHSGYPGGLKKRQWRELYAKSPRLLFMKILNNMIPANRLKKHLLKKIKFT